jgi:hypothetical protein
MSVHVKRKGIAVQDISHLYTQGTTGIELIK